MTHHAPAARAERRGYAWITLEPWVMRYACGRLHREGERLSGAWQSYETWLVRDDRGSKWHSTPWAAARDADSTLCLIELQLHWPRGDVVPERRWRVVADVDVAEFVAQRAPDLARWARPLRGQMPCIDAWLDDASPAALDAAAAEMRQRRAPLRRAGRCDERVIAHAHAATALAVTAAGLAAAWTADESVRGTATRQAIAIHLGMVESGAPAAPGVGIAALHKATIEARDAWGWLGAISKTSRHGKALARPLEPPPTQKEAFDEYVMQRLAPEAREALQRAPGDRLAWRDWGCALPRE